MIVKVLISSIISQFVVAVTREVKVCSVKLLHKGSIVQLYPISIVEH